MWLVMPWSCITYAHHMHTTYTLDAHTCSLVMFGISLMLDICYYMFSTYNMIVWHCLCLFKAFVFVLWTNLVLIKFVFLFLCFCTYFFVFYDCFVCRCLHSRNQLWKEVMAKEKNQWLMLIASPRSQRRLNHRQDFMMSTSSNHMPHFKPMRAISKMLLGWLKGWLNKRLFLIQTF